MTKGINESVFDALASGRYAFLDLGSGSGGSIDHCVRRFGMSPGLGLEFDSGLVAEGRRAGFDVHQADVTCVEAPARSVRFVSMMDFLEHLPDEATATGVIERLGPVARDFLFIRHPSFEETEYLASLGLKLCWTDWTGHPNRMTIADFRRAFARLGWADYLILPQHRIADSSHAQVVGLDAPRDIVEYDEHLDGPKPLVVFDREIYTQFDIFVRLNPLMDATEWDAIVSSDPGPEITSRHTDAMHERLQRLAGRTQPGLYTPSAGRWSLALPGEGGASVATVFYGAGGRSLVPVTGDFDGDGQDGIGVYDPANRTFFLKNVAREGHADLMFEFGPTGGQPVVGDWMGSGADCVGVFDQSTATWYLRFANAEGPADATFRFGPAGADVVPVAGDWNGRGSSSVGLYDPATATWMLRESLEKDAGEHRFAFGPPGARPVVGDWDGDGVATIGVYVPDTGTWLLRNSNSEGPADVTLHFHMPEALPVSGAWSRPR